MRGLIRAGLIVAALGAACTAAVYFAPPSLFAQPAAGGGGRAPAPAAGGGGTAPAGGVAAPAPADQPKRQELVVPPGYEKVTVAGHTALAQPADVTWVRQALADVKPPAKQGVKPGDMIQALVDKRAALTKQIVTDLALPDDRGVNEFLDAKLVPTLKKLEETRPPVFYLVTTHDKLRDLTKTGWGEPRFHYNGVANAAVFDDSIPFSIDKPMDDTVLPAFYADTVAVEQRVKNLSAGVQALDANIAANVARQANPTVFNLFVQFIQERHMDPLKLRRDQSWLAMGVSNFLATKYASVVTTVPKDQMVRELISEPQLFPVSARSIDLTRPVDEAAMKKELVPYYTVSMQRKATAVVAVWVDTAGEAAIPRTLTALRAKPPADGPALVKLIQDATGADLTKYLAAQ
jgi:hypothetical protein